MTAVAEFRSDTFTLPDAGMRRAIYQAEVGNAAYGEDPSVNALEEALAEMFERQAALFFPSATMAGQCAIAAWCRPADIVLIEEFGHNHYFETGSMAYISGTQANAIPGLCGILSTEQLARSIQHMENPNARTALIILENTSNFGGGTVYPLMTLESIFALGQSHKLPVHIDGARIFNALQYYRQLDSTLSPASIVPQNGSISVCFSKGLGAPMGAALIGDAAFIVEAERIRALLGGTLRQSGFMAAAALYGLQNNQERLAQDHANASLLAAGLAAIEGLQVNLDAVQTNMVYIEVNAGEQRAARLVQQLEERGIRAWNLKQRLRFVTSMLVQREDCVRTIAAAASAMAGD